MRALLILVALSAGAQGQATPPPAPAGDDTAAAQPGDELLPVSPKTPNLPVLESNKPIAASIRAELHVESDVVPVGSPVMVEFVLYNKSDEKVKLAVPGALEGRERCDYGMGLPLEHIFSGPGFRGLEVSSETFPNLGDRITREPEFPVPSITLAPFATVGLRFDVTRFYPAMHQAGIYELRWRPYNGAIEAMPLVVSVIQFKQVALQTDLGTLNLQLFYDRAPQHVANFLDLVEHRFYNGKTFHLVYPNQFILGGDPHGDGTGKRPDGLTLPPEFNATPFEFGTVGMALIEGDPNSGSCQFFICLSRQPSWDGRYTAFGRVAGPQSLEVLRRIGQVPVDEARRPTKTLVIKSASAIDAPLLTRANP